MHGGNVKYRLKDGLAPLSTTLGHKTYNLSDKIFREYPPAILSMYAAVLVPETQPKPKKTEPEVTDGSN